MIILPTNKNTINQKTISEKNGPNMMRIAGFTTPPAKKIGLF
jgi:hypothetical protein